MKQYIYFIFLSFSLLNFSCLKHTKNQTIHNDKIISNDSTLTNSSTYALTNLYITKAYYREITIDFSFNVEINCLNSSYSKKSDITRNDNSISYELNKNCSAKFISFKGGPSEDCLAQNNVFFSIERDEFGAISALNSGNNHYSCKSNPILNFNIFFRPNR